MTIMIIVPKAAGNAAAAATVLDPGEYQVQIKHIAQRDPGRAGALLEVLDEGEFQGVAFWDNFNLQHEKGCASLLELLKAVGVTLEDTPDVEATQFDADQCVGKTLVVKVKHREEHGKVYVNVVEHKPS